MDTQIVEILSFSEDIEEEVLVTNGEIDLLCFAGKLPLTKVGDKWHVELNLFVMFDYNVSELDDYSEDIIERIGTSYRYKIAGRLINGRLQSCGYSFSNNALQSEYLYLEGSMISLGVDRINIDFLASVT